MLTTVLTYNSALLYVHFMTDEKSSSTVLIVKYYYVLKLLYQKLFQSTSKFYLNLVITNLVITKNLPLNLIQTKNLLVQFLVLV